MRLHHLASGALAALGLLVGATGALAEEVRFDVQLTGDEVVPPTRTGGNATVVALLDTDTGKFSVEGAYEGLRGDAFFAALHGPAGRGENAREFAIFEINGGLAGEFSGAAELTDEQMAWVLEGKTYLDIITSAYPDGEIRGQLAGVAPPPLEIRVALEGAQEVPPVDTPGYGVAIVKLYDSGLIEINGGYRDMLGDADAAHLHGPARRGENAGPIVHLKVSGWINGEFSGSATLTSEQVAWVREGRTYLNVHSKAKPTGEIRGQVETEQPCYADCDGNGRLDIRDFFCFQGLYAGGDMRADCDRNGRLDIRDFFCFQSAYAAGCR